MHGKGCVHGWCWQRWLHYWAVFDEVEACLYTLRPMDKPALPTACVKKVSVCVPGDTCRNGIQDLMETDIDCGGGGAGSGCGGCGIGGGCEVGGHCLSGVCDPKDSNTCEATYTCGNGVC